MPDAMPVSGLLLKLRVSPVAVFAVLWRRLVEQNLFSLPLFEELVTIAATDVPVCARQRELRTLVVIEK